MRTTVGRPLAQLILQIEPFSLEKQGLLAPPERQGALLSINRDQDTLVTIEDLHIISRSGIEQEEWVYPGYSHCAPESFPEHIPRSAAWLRARLTEVGHARVESEPVLAEDAATVVPTARLF
jgi:hypothetical protein